VALVTVSREAVQSRITGTGRPLLANGLESWDRLVAGRSDIYQSLATRSWDTSGRPVGDLAREIAQWSRDIRTKESHNE
jgi:shikimate kinase